MIRRDGMLQIVHDELPELYPFIHMCNSTASLLSFGEHRPILPSDAGFQPGDPRGPLLFCASSLKLARSMTSEFNDWNLDDGSIGGHVNRLLSDPEIVRRVGPTIGLVLNEVKCEIVTDDADVVASLKAVVPSIRHIPCHEAVLSLQSATKQLSTQSSAVQLAVFRRLAGRLTSSNAHDALFLLKNCFCIPKLLYTLRCAACYTRAPPLRL